jgi:DNA-binding transcriptional MerR regulator
MTAKEICQSNNVSYHTLHHYRRAGLIPFKRENASKYLYDSEEVSERLNIIKGMQYAGYTLEYIKERFHQYNMV